MLISLGKYFINIIVYMRKGITFALIMKTRLLKVSEYARENKISVKSVYKQIEKKKLKTVNKFGLILIKQKI